MIVAMILLLKTFVTLDVITREARDQAKVTKQGNLTGLWLISPSSLCSLKLLQTFSNMALLTTPQFWLTLAYKCMLEGHLFGFSISGLNPLTLKKS